MVKLGSTFTFGDAKAVVVTSVNISYSKRDFTRVSLELIVPSSFGLSNVGELDLSQIFKSPAVSKAINQEVQRQARKISFTDR